MNARKWIALVLFVLAAVFNLVGNYADIVLMQRVTKPVLMPLVLLNALLALEGTPAPKWLYRLLACVLIFHCCGDCLLMLPGFPFFVAGLVCFLVGHVFYVIIFSKTGVFRKCPFGMQFLMNFLVICIPLVLVNVLDFEGPIKYAVLVYAITLLYVAGCGAVGAFNRNSGVSKPVYLLALAGGILFISSDFLVACRSLLDHTFPHMGFAIMLTYILAECMIVTSIVRPYLKHGSP